MQRARRKKYFIIEHAAVRDVACICALWGNVGRIFFQKWTGAWVSRASLNINKKKSYIKKYERGH